MDLYHSRTAPLFDQLRGTAPTGGSAGLLRCWASREEPPRAHVSKYQAGKTKAGRHTQTHSTLLTLLTHTPTHRAPHKTRGPAPTGMLQPPRLSFSDYRLLPSAAIQIRTHLGLTTYLYLVHHLAAVQPASQPAQASPILPSHLGTLGTQYLPPSLLEHYFARIPPSRSRSHPHYQYTLKPHTRRCQQMGQPLVKLAPVPVEVSQSCAMPLSHASMLPCLLPSPLSRR